MKTITYKINSGEVDKEISKAWSYKITQHFELCFGWYGGNMPTWFYFNPNGRLHPGSVSLTLRIFRAMIGWRIYN